MKEIILEKARWYWMFIPILAVIAYLPVLDVGFLSDDYGFLFRAETRDLRGYLGWQIFLPSQGAGVSYYRPFGMLTTWQLGWQLWGLNPFPYHALGLLLHAATSLVLGLCVADFSGKRNVGILAGALFAVFPLHHESVAWLSAQWDIWAALFAITSLWLFLKWWRTKTHEYDSPITPSHKRRLLYSMALLSYGLAVFSKESALTWIGILCLVPLFCSPKGLRTRWSQATVALLPFFVILLIYITIRLVAIGNFGGYSATSNSFDTLIANALGDVTLLIAPLNSSILGEPLRLLVGILLALMLLTGLILYASSVLKSLVFFASWLAITVIPVLNLEVYQEDLQGARLLYLPSAGYCGLAMVLVVAAIDRLGSSQKKIAAGFITACLGAFAITSWFHLNAWRIATVQADFVGETVAHLIPTGDLESSPTAMLWYVQDAPDNYKGAQVMRNGLDDLYHFLTGAPVPRIEYTTSVESVSVSNQEQDTFALKFAYDDVRRTFYLPHVRGITSETLPLSQNAERSQLWNFQSCAQDALAQWEAINASVECQSEIGILFQPLNDDPQLLSRNIPLPLELTAGSYLRVAIQMRVPQIANISENEASNNMLQLFWSVTGNSPTWNPELSKTIETATNDKAYVYWFVIPGTSEGQRISGFRIDPPLYTSAPIEIEWLFVGREF